MHIEYLEEFIELGQCLSFTEAARRCNITQPALSKHLASLESELGAQLVDRDRHSVELSQAGHALLRDAIPLCDQYRAMRKHVKSLASLPLLRIGGLLQNPRVLWIISSTLSRKDNGQSVSCTYNQTLSRPFDELLEKKEVDLVFTYEDSTQRAKSGEQFSRMPLFDDHFVAVVPINNPLSKKDALSMTDLADETFIKLSGPYFAWGWNHIEAVCQAHGYTPKTRPAIMQPGLDYSLVNLDDSIMILSQSALTGQLFTRMKTYRCIPLVDDDALFSIYAVYRTGDRNRSLELFLEQMTHSLSLPSL